MSRPKGSKAHYNSRVANRICENLAMGDSLKTALEKDVLAPTVQTIYRWLDMYPAFREKYERARLLQADVHADTMMDMARDVVKNPQKASAYRVAADILQWQAAMRNPKMYGSKVTVESKAAPMNAAQIKAEIAVLEKELNVDSAITNKSRDAAERMPAAQPDPIVDDEPLQLKPSLFDRPVGPVQ